ncbi:spermine oxidase [Nasonia vitripennis]|uniref:Amine oxidase domain-containing protein n=1 Tax=Nasonia vitripennis TaxID=7425 RepID=A0A7M7TAL8_NASVI|nr:spermine oxidase [Nasonia vitripennis]
MNLGRPESFIETTKLVIVGAGIAGLGAALTLEKCNFKDYILIEAQSEIGGRICSIPWNDGWIEHGAQFLHGRGSTLGKFAEEKGFLSDDEVAEGEGLYLREDGTEMDHELVREVDDIVKNIMEDCEKYATNNEIEYLDVEENIGKVLKTRFCKYLTMTNDPLSIRNAKEELFDWNVRFLAIDNACNSLNELSVKSWGKFKAVSGPEHNIFKSRYGSMVESIAGELIQENIRLNSPVKKIEWNEQVNSHDSKTILVTLQNNKQILANCIIVTCSLGVLKETHNKLFSPILPVRLRGAIESMGFGMINKVFLDFDEPWWEPGTKGFQFLWRTETDNCTNNQDKNKLPLWTRDLTGFDVLPGHRSVLLGWIGRKGARIIESLSEQQIIRDCSDLFKYFLKRNEVPEARKCLRSRWSSNEFIRGGYSHITKKCDVIGVSPATLAEPIWGMVSSHQKDERLPILMLAGEATHENYYSTTHGAYDTGVKQAQTFLQYHVTK